jgi:hypothetical protein
MRESVGPQPLDSIKSRLESLRSTETGGATGGVWDTIHKKIDNALAGLKGIEETISGRTIPERTRVVGGSMIPVIEQPYTQKIVQGTKPSIELDTSTGLHKYIPGEPNTVVTSGGIKNLSPQIESPELTRGGRSVVTSGGKGVNFTGIEPQIKVELGRVERLKKEISDSVNWLNDNATQRSTKKIAMSIEKGVEDILGKEGIDLNKYKLLKQKYADAELMKKALNNEIAGNESRMPIGLVPMVSGAGRGTPESIMRMLVTEGVRRRGAGASANALKSMAQSRYPTGGLSALLSVLKGNK